MERINGLLKILACPMCKKDLGFIRDKNMLKCKSCGRDYYIKDGIPVMIPKDL